MHKTPPQPSAKDAVDQATLKLLQSWQSEDATTDPEKLRAAERELAEFKQAMNDARSLSGELQLFSQAGFSSSTPLHSDAQQR